MSAISFHDGRVCLYDGDCLAILDGLAENSLDSCVTDPPYHLTSIVKRFGADGAAPAQHGTDGAFARAGRGFMGKQWDGGDVAFQVETWTKVLRVLKPGAYLVAFSSSRTFGRMSVAIEDAGFITHPMIGWIFGSGFPKATRIKAEGYEGYRYGGQALKPALEPIYVGQKPFSEENGTANILKWGTGSVNIDGCRIETAAGDYDHPGDLTKRPMAVNTYSAADRGDRPVTMKVPQAPPSPLGRWPANLIHDGSPEVLAGFPIAPGQQADISPDAPSATTGNVYGKMNRHGEKSSDARYQDRGATDFAALPGMRRNDSGSAARFFYQAKADTEDRLGSKHPTVKPLDLMRWLVRLVTPPGGAVLDPFAGTGTTAHAALIEGMRAVLCEREPEYQADIARRMGARVRGARRACSEARNTGWRGIAATVWGRSMTRHFRFIRITQMDAALRAGWLPTRDLHGCHHGEWSVLCCWPCDCPEAWPLDRSAA